MSDKSLVIFDEDKIQLETDRIHQKMKHLGWSRFDCEVIAPVTLEINQLKKEQNAVILAHSYQNPEIIFGVSDFTGDSLGLSRNASETEAEIILFAGVKFMAETAKIISPEKIVLLPSEKAGCSLADSIMVDDIEKLKKEHPNTPVVCYVNTSAEVKAASDICVTSANVVEIVESLENNKIIFVPDKNMANYLQKKTDKEIISWNGTCIVHEDFSPISVLDIREQFQDVVILAHSECPPDVLDEVDLVGGTSDMVRYVKDNPDKKRFMLVTECGLGERLAIEFPDREFVGTCTLC
ncbi:MAG: quinolinate synthase NadA, partial [Candidatus Heimdallarchaeota archaeon]|nr:quinolinate synthase NadA [Candidatus Heimdallarchaeota archaeon]